MTRKYIWKWNRNLYILFAGLRRQHEHFRTENLLRSDYEGL